MTLRATALLALAAFAVHEARYALVPDVHAAAGHGYLAAAPIVLTLLLALAAGRSLAVLGCRARPGRRLSWVAATAAIVAVHGGQESLERLVAGGGPIDVGLLVVLPLAALAGLAVAALLGRAERLLAEASAPAHALRPPIPATLLVLDTGNGRVAIPAGIARHRAGRGPPAFG